MELEIFHLLIRKLLDFILFYFCSVKLKHFKKFTDTAEALAATTAAVEGKMSKSLRKLLKKVVAKDLQNQLLLADAKLGSAIKDKLNVPCLSNTAVQELMRCV